MSCNINLIRRTVFSAEQMEELGSQISQVLHHGDVVYLKGALGAGKTTLARGIARGKGFAGRVTSPTFTLMNIYEAQVPIYHFDFYRLEGCDLGDLGLVDYMEREGISLVEWPQVGEGPLPSDALVIEIEIVEDDYDRERLVSITAQGKTYCHKVEELERRC